MKRMLWTLLTITLLAGVSGCCWPPRPFLPGCIIGCGRNCLKKTGGCAEACGAECRPDGCGQCAGAGCEGCGGAGCEMCGGVGCDTCRGAGCGQPRALACGSLGCLGAGRQADQFMPGPPSAAITYPYYSNRGPRDFLAESPPSIGP
jgi:hypothetical protein